MIDLVFPSLSAKAMETTQDFQLTQYFLVQYLITTTQTTAEDKSSPPLCFADCAKAEGEREGNPFNYCSSSLNFIIPFSKASPSLLLRVKL